MRGYGRWAPIGAAVLGLAACTRTFDIRVVQVGQEVRFDFVKGLIFKQPHSVCVGGADVIERPQNKIVWSLRAQGGASRHFTSLKVGEVPEGYVGENSRVPLKPGQQYEVGVMGEGEVGATNWKMPGPSKPTD